jgi:hypothetical protein
MPDETQTQAPNAAATIEPTVIERAENILKEVEKREKALGEKEKQFAERILGGRANAGVQPLPVKEETPAEYAKRIVSGKV